MLDRFGGSKYVVRQISPDFNSQLKEQFSNIPGDSVNIRYKWILLYYIVNVVDWNRGPHSVIIAVCVGQAAKKVRLVAFCTGDVRINPCFKSITGYCI